MRLLFGITLALFVGADAALSVQVPVSLEMIDQAITLGRTAIASERARFHDAYRVVVARAPVDYLEIVTPFRRVVLAVQERASKGDQRYGQRQVIEMLGTTAEQLDIHVELTFHPLNTYIGIPDYIVELRAVRGRSIGALGIDRLSRWTPRLGGLPPAIPKPGNLASAPRSGPLVGGTLIARFDLRLLDPKGVYDVVVREGNQEIAVGRADLGTLR
jgi:hypothetical protein